MKKSLILTSLITILSVFSIKAYSHCEVPCGIYNDQLRIELIKEHIETINKAITSIIGIESSDSINYNQLVRWINTKDDHANKIQYIVQQYFLTQRVKYAAPSDDEKYKTYISQLTYLHQLTVYAMKAKQTTNVNYVTDMTNALTGFEKAYFKNSGHTHGADG
ncbi:MAG: superoxide dismutase [Bacteroidetes bacterium]|nr:superoxide dismutase [Bacteroidota bacterium]